MERICPDLRTVFIVLNSRSVAEVFDYWAHASAIDIGENMTAPDNFESRAQVKFRKTVTMS